jgi:cis-L-3-hydroxyproline dehydratase
MARRRPSQCGSSCGWRRSRGAEELIDITRAHIDGCIYTGPGGLAFAEKLKDLGGRVKVPTTLNAISVDQRGWRAQGIPPAFGEPASRLADAYVAMGAQPTFTCAPYLLDDRPERDEQIVWAESNAVVFANSVLGARTMKYPDYLDICVALTGRAPKAGCHLDSERLPGLRIRLSALEQVDDSLYPLLGYLIGTLAPDTIPVVEGLADHAPDQDDLKAFGAAFATTSAAPMFHIAGVTPEAISHGGYANLTLPMITISAEQLRQAWVELNGAPTGSVELVSLGNPHFSVAEIAKLAALCRNRTKHPDVALIVTCGRHVLEKARAAGDVTLLEAFGVSFVTDTCWCMITEPLITPATKVIMTNSGKYAHYGPGLSGRTMRFGSLAACVDAAALGHDLDVLPAWLPISGNAT